LPENQEVLDENKKIKLFDSKDNSHFNDFINDISKSISIQGAITCKGILINSGEFDGLTSDEAKIKITEKVGGKLETQFRLRDWIISRQRYWGAPIPMIHCDACAKAGKGEQPDMPGWYGEQEKNLPVELPFIEDFRPQGTGISPLATNESFYKTTCPHCGAEARRETDVSDTFLDSAWYYLRYPNVRNDAEAWNKEITKIWCPVDMYIGGAEHSVLHLLYVRFVAMALHDAGLLDFEEPFPKFRAHGLLIKDGAKMSKSKGNVINPDEYVTRFGADTLRMYLMFLAPFEQGGDFRDAGILGIVRFLERAWKVFHKKEIKEKISESLDVSMHKAIKKVTEDIESLHYNTAISALMVFLNDIEADGEMSQEVRETFLKLIAPFAPHIAEELWHEFENNSVHTSSWPTYDASKLHEGTVSIVIQVNGKLRGTITIARDASEDVVEKIARADERISEYLKGNIVKKIFVPNRLMNFVVQ
jgi:leucyl-tRNA synthetase